MYVVVFQASHCSFMLPNVFLSKNCNCGLWKQFNRVCFLFLQRPCLVSSGVQSCISLTKCHLDVILMDVEVWLRMQWCQLQFYSNMLPDNKECTHWQERTAIWIWAHCSMMPTVIKPLCWQSFACVIISKCVTANTTRWCDESPNYFWFSGLGKRLSMDCKYNLIWCGRCNW